MGAGGGTEGPAWEASCPLAAGEQAATPTPVTGLPDGPCPPRLPSGSNQRSWDIPGLRGPHRSKRWGASTRHALLSPPPNTNTQKSLTGGTSPAAFSGELPGGPQPRKPGPGLQVHSHHTTSADRETQRPAARCPRPATWGRGVWPSPRPAGWRFISRCPGRTLTSL